MAENKKKNRRTLGERFIDFLDRRTFGERFIDFLDSVLDVLNTDISFGGSDSHSHHSGWGGHSDAGGHSGHCDDHSDGGD